MAAHPNVYNYDAIRELVSAWREHYLKLSWEALAEALGSNTSDTWRAFARGKSGTIPPALERALVRLMGLDEAAATHVHHLIVLDSAPPGQQREAALRAVERERLHHRGRALGDAQASFLEEEHLPVLFELLRCMPPGTTLDALAAWFHPPIPQAQLRRMGHQLVELGLARMEGSRLVPNDAQVLASAERISPLGEAQRKSHARTLRRVARAVEKDPPGQRYVAAAVVALSEDQRAEADAIMFRALKEILALSETCAEPDQVYVVGGFACLSAARPRTPNPKGRRP